MIIGIVGLGLIGGSMAKSIKKRTEHTVLGADISGETLTLALMSGGIDAELTTDNIRDCDLILLAVGPDAAIEWAKNNADLISSDAVLIDLCGVKRAVCDALRPLAEKHSFAYIGGHPMAGKEVGGYVNSSDELFRGAYMILTPDENTDIVLLEKLQRFFISVGFKKLTFTTPEEHDRIMSYTSQLAHITSSAYVKSPTAQEHLGFSAGSFRDMTRVARLDPAMWTRLFSLNRDYLLPEIKTLITNLTAYADALESGDDAELRRLLEDGLNKKLTAGGI